MKQDRFNIKTLFNLILLLAVLVITLTACAPMRGVASMTLISREQSVENKKFAPVGEIVEESECINSFLTFGVAGILPPTHESIVSRTLEKYNADVLLNAELTTRVVDIPIINLLFAQSCAIVKGQPARIIDGGAK